MRGSYTTPFVHGVVDLSIREKFFSNRYRSGVQTSLCKLLRDYEANAAFDFRSNFFTLTVGFNNEDNCCQSQELEKSFKDMLSKGILGVTFRQVYHE